MQGKVADYDLRIDLTHSSVRRRAGAKPAIGGSNPRLVNVNNRSAQTLGAEARAAQAKSLTGGSDRTRASELAEHYPKS
jgi:hypothetical protein